MINALDKQINDIVTLFTANLWPSNVRQFYGRIFRNEVNYGFSVKVQPLYYSDQVNAEAIDVLKNDLVDAQCFFDVLPNAINRGGIIEQDVRLMWMVDLSKLYPTLSRNEATETFYNDVEEWIYNTNFELNGYVQGATGFKDYQWSEDALCDLQNNYLFRFDLKLFYVNNIC